MATKLADTKSRVRKTFIVRSKCVSFLYLILGVSLGLSSLVVLVTLRVGASYQPFETVSWIVMCLKRNKETTNKKECIPSSWYVFLHLYAFWRCLTSSKLLSKIGQSDSDSENTYSDGASQRLHWRALNQKRENIHVFLVLVLQKYFRRKYVFFLSLFFPRHPNFFRFLTTVTKDNHPTRIKQHHVIWTTLKMLPCSPNCPTHKVGILFLSRNAVTNSKIRL